MTTKLSSILQAENLEHLLTNFTDQGVTDSILSDLSDSDLKDLGIDKLGERKRLLVAFKGGATPETAAPIAAAAPPSVETTASPATAATAPEATKESPFVNSLGMPFVPIPRFDTRFCIWPVRVQDYEAYCMATGVSFPSVSFPQGPDHPIVGVTWENAIDFCVWLTEKERNEGVIDDSAVYRLPTDLEWSAAVGLPHEPEPTPEMRHLKAPGYPWGLRWPPPNNAGNYEPDREDQLSYLRKAHIARGQYNDPHVADTASRFLTDIHTAWKNDWVCSVDNFRFTSPVGSFSANAFALFDLGGNVWEWCMDILSVGSTLRVLRGASNCTSYDNPSCDTTRIGGFRKVHMWSSYYASVFVPASNRNLYQSSFRNACAQSEYAVTRLANEAALIAIDSDLNDLTSVSYPTNGFRLALVTEAT